MNELKMNSISAKGKIFNFVIRNGYFLRGKLKREVFDMNTSIVKYREQCEKSAARYSKVPGNMQIKADVISGMQSEWYFPKGATSDKMILYMHGGGYVSGSCSDHRGFVTKFAQSVGVTTLIFDYRLAPEHPFPAAIDDAVTMYRYILEEGYKAENILIAGESAGGGLCLALLLALKMQNRPLPKAAVAISPWTDLACSSESYKTKGHLSPAPTNCWNVFSRHYVGNNSPHNPLISPLYGDLKGLPPIFINSGVDDELFEDGAKFFKKANEAGVDITFRAGEGMIHCYPLLAPMFKEATDAMNEIVNFVRTQLQLNS